MDFFTTSYEMLDLGLSLRERTAFAIIYSFSQRGEGCWWGSLTTMAKWLDCTKRHAVEILQRLQDQGLVEKRKTLENGRERCYYYASEKAVNSLHPVNSVPSTGELTSPLPVNSLHPTGELSSPNNKKIYKEDKERDNSFSTQPPKPFDLFKALTGAGVNAATAHDWLQVRKTKRLASTETGWQETLAEIRKTGYSAEYCIRTAVAQGWGGFRADWLDRLLNGNGSPAYSRKPKDGDAMMKMYEALTRRQEYDPNDLPDLPDEQ